VLGVYTDLLFEGIAALVKSKGKDEIGKV